jgi:hypothetical protein
MAAHLTIRNDGPDDAEIRIAHRSRVIKAGQQVMVSTRVTADILPLAKMTPTELAMHMGTPTAIPQAPLRYEED